MIKIVDLAQNSPEWLEFRKDKVGASDASIIMEISPWKTPFQLWKEKMGLVVQEQTPAMKRGHELEGLARSCFEDMMKGKFDPVVMVNSSLPWMIASLDGYNFEKKEAVEIKCASHTHHKLACEGKIPDIYYPQLQHQMEVAKLDYIYYFSFDGNDGVCVKCERDSQYIVRLIQKERAFYICMKELIEPALVAKDFVLREDLDWEYISEQWKNAKEQLNESEKKENELREKLIQLSNDKNSLGNGVKLSKILRKGNIDYSLVPELKNIDLEKYRKEKTFMWKIYKEIQNN